MKDFRGREIKLGDVVVYPVRQGSSLWMNEMLVTDVGIRLKGRSPSGKIITIHKVGNVTVVS